MRRFVQHLGAISCGASLFVLFGAGCEARKCDDVKTVEYEGDSDTPSRQEEQGACVELVQLKKWWGETEDFQGDYASGKNVVVDNGNGLIEVKVTDWDDVYARFKPFVSRAFDTCEGEDDTGDGRCTEIDDNLADQELIFEEEDGNYLIQAKRTNAVATLGAEILVELPSSFDGRLTVDQNNGPTDIGPMGDAAAVIVESDNGSCDIETGAASHIDIRCKNGSTDVVVGAISEGSEVRQIYKTADDLGDLSVEFPSTNQPFNVEARSAGSEITLMPSDLGGTGCEQVEGSVPASLTVSCNDGTSDDPTFKVTSDESLVDITLSF